MEKNSPKSYTPLNRIYFWTATINSWLPLLEPDKNKFIIIESLKYLSDKKLITIFGFVIMPNHIHLIWCLDKTNGKESAKGSFLKYTAHLLLKELKQGNISSQFESKKANKKHEIWKRDSLGIEIYNKEIAKQKLDYIHFNPVNGKWKLSIDDLDYFFSSSRFYETGIDEFGFLINIFEFFDGW